MRAPLRLFLVDDDSAVRSVIERRFAAESIAVDEFADGESALAAFAIQPPDIVVLDLLLPGMGGLAVLAELRSSSNVPVILLSGLADEADRVSGLELGADDYVVKPFSPRELLARVRSVMRRFGPNPEPIATRVAYPGLEIDVLAREVLIDGESIELTRREFDLLAFFARSPRQTFSRAQLLEQVWGSSADWQDEATVTEHVHRLRQRIEKSPEAMRHIQTVRGVGYRFQP
jgi:two-component system phosphate regulon response regulator PhoB